jgi:hypothetical protein
MAFTASPLFSLLFFGARLVRIWTLAVRVHWGNHGVEASLEVHSNRWHQGRPHPEAAPATNRGRGALSSFPEY